MCACRVGDDRIEQKQHIAETAVFAAKHFFHAVYDIAADEKLDQHLNENWPQIVRDQHEGNDIIVGRDIIEPCIMLEGNSGVINQRLVVAEITGGQLDNQDHGEHEQIGQRTFHNLKNSVFPAVFINKNLIKTEVEEKEHNIGQQLADDIVRKSGRRQN